jgi:hypothetical protein
MIILASFPTQEQAEVAELALARTILQLSGTRRAVEEYKGSNSKELKAYGEKYEKEMGKHFNKIFGIKTDSEDNMFELDWSADDVGIGTDGEGTLKFNVYTAGYGMTGIENFLSSQGAVDIRGVDEIATSSPEGIVEDMQMRFHIEKMAEIAKKGGKGAKPRTRRK